MTKKKEDPNTNQSASSSSQNRHGDINTERVKSKRVQKPRRSRALFSMSEREIDRERDGLTGSYIWGSLCSLYFWFFPSMKRRRRWRGVCRLGKNIYYFGGRCTIKRKKKEIKLLAGCLAFRNVMFTVYLWNWESYESGKSL